MTQSPPLPQSGGSYVVGADGVLRPSAEAGEGLPAPAAPVAPAPIKPTVKGALNPDQEA